MENQNRISHYNLSGKFRLYACKILMWLLAPFHQEFQQSSIWVYQFSFLITLTVFSQNNPVFRDRNSYINNISFENANSIPNIRRNAQPAFLINLGRKSYIARTRATVSRELRSFSRSIHPSSQSPPLYSYNWYLKLAWDGSATSWGFMQCCDLGLTIEFLYYSK